MGAELVVIIGTAAAAKGLVSAAVVRRALTSVVGMGAAVIAAKVAADAARGVAHMVIGGRVEAIEAYATGLGLNSQAADLEHGMLTAAGEEIERHFDSEAEEAFTDCVYSLANAHAGYSQLLRTVADAVTRYANELSFHRGQTQDAQERVIGAADRIDDIDVRWTDVIDDEADDAEGARVKDLINSNLGHIERELERVIDNCDELLSEEVSILSTLLQAGDRVVDTVRHLPQQLDLASHGGGGRNEYDPFRPGEIHPGSQIKPKKGQKDGASGTWTSVTRGPSGRPYQRQIASTPRAWGGHVLEYRLDYTPPRKAGPLAKKHVDFDGHTWRDDPTTGAKKEVYLEAKDGYRDLIVNVSEDERKEYLERFITQAKRQLAAMDQNGSSNARLEWHFSDPDVADCVRAAFAEEPRDEELGVEVKDVLVYYTPKVRR